VGWLARPWGNDERRNVANAFEQLEIQELIEKLRANGFGRFVDACIDGLVYTKSGRLNKSAACKILGLKPNEMERALKQMQALLTL
jgi:hypothetical protein